MRRLLVAASLMLAPLAAGAHAVAIGPNGGPVVDSGGHHVEMVANGLELTLFLTDGGETPLASAGARNARAVVQDGGKTATVLLQPAPPNRLVGALAQPGPAPAWSPPQPWPTGTRSRRASSGTEVHPGRDAASTREDSTMRTFTKTLLTAGLAASLAGGAHAQATHGGHIAASSSVPMPGMDPGMAAMMADMQPKPTDTASTKDFKEAHARMMRAMHKPFTGDPDVDFRVHMIPHHQGAVDMARIVLKYAKDPETRTMADSIVKDQEREIGEMQAWLKKHGT